MRTSYLTSTIPPSLPPPPPAAGELQVAPPRVVEVGVGEAVQIPCISPISNVPTAVCWTKILEGGRTASVSSQNSLLLRKTTYSDGGRYRCVASDATRTVESDDVDVVVTGAPVVEAVTLRCSLSAAAHPHRPRLRPPIGVHPHLASPRPPPARETRRDERQVQSPQPHGGRNPRLPVRRDDHRGREGERRRQLGPRGRERPGCERRPHPTQHHRRRPLRHCQRRPCYVSRPLCRYPSLPSCCSYPFLRRPRPVVGVK
nr:uncharacterized protein LOC113801919 isoform X2 [Penaeus vannamei]